MIKPFVSFSSLLLLMVLVVGVHYLSFAYQKNLDAMQNVTKLTQYSILSLSLTYDDTLVNTTYPEISTLSRMDFVYER